MRSIISNNHTSFALTEKNKSSSFCKVALLFTVSSTDFTLIIAPPIAYSSAVAPALVLKYCNPVPRAPSPVPPRATAKLPVVILPVSTVAISALTTAPVRLSFEYAIAAAALTSALTIPKARLSFEYAIAALAEMSALTIPKARLSFEYAIAAPAAMSAFTRANNVRREYGTVIFVVVCAAISESPTAFAAIFAAVTASSCSSAVAISAPKILGSVAVGVITWPLP